MVTARSRRSSVLFLFFVLLFTAPVHGPIVAIGDPLDSVRAKFAPDRRVALFDVKLETTAEGVVVSGEVESTAARDAALEAARSGGATAIDRITILPAASLGTETHGVVRVSVANVRGKPAHAAEMVTQTLMGWPVRVLKEQGGWYLVHTEPDGYLGWIEELQIERMSEPERRAWESAPLAVITSPFAVIREAPLPTATPVADIVLGALVRKVSTAGDWTKIVLPDDRIGWVSAADAQDYSKWQASRRVDAVAFEQTARMLTGVPYLWGGTSSKGLDCSGFVKTVLHMNGVELPRDTDQQAQAGQPVSLADNLSHLEAGDLLFFGTAATADKPERISHVGLHLGHLEFIHASGFVRRSSLDPASPIYSESLRNRLLRARRVISAPKATS